MYILMTFLLYKLKPLDLLLTDITSGLSLP